MKHYFFTFVLNKINHQNHPTMITKIKKSKKSVHVTRVLGTDTINWKTKDGMRPVFQQLFQETKAFLPNIMGVTAKALDLDKVVIRQVELIDNQDSEAIQIIAEYNAEKGVSVITTGQVNLEELPGGLSEHLDDLRNLAEEFLAGARQQLELEFEQEEAA